LAMAVGAWTLARLTEAVHPEASRVAPTEPAEARS
jgi:hypothetical protein